MLARDSDLFQRLSLGESLRRIIAVYWEQGIFVFTKIGALIAAINAILLPPLKTYLAGNVDAEDAFVGDPQYLQEHTGALYGLSGIQMLVAVVIVPVGCGAMICAVADIYLGREPAFQKCLRVGIQHACTILGASFLGFLGVALASAMLLVAPGIYLGVKLWVVNPVIVVESLGIFDSFRRSMTLVSGSWCYVFCTLLIVNIVMAVLGTIWTSLVFAIIGIDQFNVLGFIVAAIPSVASGPVFVISMTILYINLRIEKEGLNRDVLARNLLAEGRRKWRRS